MKRCKPQHRSAFSLVELLASMVIITLLASVALSAFNSVTSNMNLTQTGQLVADQIARARQEATVKNTIVEIRFVQDESDSTLYVAIQTWILDSAGENAKAQSKVQSFPSQVIVNNGLSPLLAKASESGTARFSSLGDRIYKAIQFRANGRLITDLGLSNTYLTIQSKNADLTSPNNYYTIQVNPMTGRVSYYRP